MKLTMPGIIKLSPSRYAALTKLIKQDILWSGTTPQETRALNWLVKNGYAKTFNGRYAKTHNAGLAAHQEDCVCEPQKN